MRLTFLTFELVNWHCLLDSEAWVCLPKDYKGNKSQYRNAVASGPAKLSGRAW